MQAARNVTVFWCDSRLQAASICSGSNCLGCKRALLPFTKRGVMMARAGACQRNHSLLFFGLNTGRSFPNHPASVLAAARFSMGQSTYLCFAALFIQGPSALALQSLSMIKEGGILAVGHLAPCYGCEASWSILVHPGRVHR